ncbi:MAG: sigma-54 interaction domain-containing protein [Eubacterium sp.]|jgi:arginine utilization regulatory protein
MGNINIEKLLNIYNYFDGIIITDENAKILYYSNFNTEIYNLHMDQIIGKTILEIHPDMRPEDSTILKVLKTGKPIYNHIEHLTTPHGDTITNICSTLPLLQRGRIVGTIDYSRGLDDGKNRSIQRSGINVAALYDSDNRKLYHVSDIITRSAKMSDIVNRIYLISNTDSPVMIFGETGTGKQMIAESIHTSGNRAGKRFISQNCAAIPETLLESTLFGTVKGAFTGAENRAGLFEIADGGTLFLDELNSMSPGMQAKILKAVEEHRIVRLGSEKEIPVDVKIITALNQDPISCVQSGSLRKDLFYRLGTVQLSVPPLRERGEDIPLLVNHFIVENNKLMNRRVMGIDEEVGNFFKTYSWPGNVRELRNVIEGAFNIVSSEMITLKDLPLYLTHNYANEHAAIMDIDESLPLYEKVAIYEKKQIAFAINSSKTLKQAAEKLGITKQALNYKLLKYKMK